jgi:hypothetical protein
MPYYSTAVTAGGSRRMRKVSPRVESLSTSSQDTPEEQQRHEDAVPLLDGHHTSSRPHRSTGSSNSVIVSPSVRALAALSGSALPISPDRVEAEAARSTSSIPRSRLRSPSNELGSMKRSTYPNSTVKTAELIETFPDPPRPRVRIRNSAPARMSLFPQVAGSEERTSNNSGLPPDARNHDSANSGSEQSIPYTIDGTRSPSASNAWLSGALPNPPECDGSVDTTACNSCPVRGEDVRYRHSGTPVYDGETASLKELDQNDDVAMTASLDRAGSPVSAKTSATRFFSAASQLRAISLRPETNTPAPMIQEAHVQARDENRVQQERAVANGALRFVSQTVSATEPSSSAREEEAVPVTMTGHGRACRHKKGSARAQRPNQGGVDGIQESEVKQTIQDRRCLICRAKRVVHEISRSVGNRDHPRPASWVRKKEFSSFGHC